MEERRRGLVGRSQAAPVVSCSNPRRLAPNNPGPAPEVSSPTEEYCQTRATPISNHGKLFKIGPMQTPIYREECLPNPCEVCTNNPHGLKIRNLGDTQSTEISNAIKT